MSTSTEVKKELDELIKNAGRLLSLTADTKDTIGFGSSYQMWYSSAYKLVEGLAPERLGEFAGYYMIDPKRKTTSVENYVIQDYVKGIGAPYNKHGKPQFDINNLISIRITNQIQIISSLRARIDSVLQDVQGHLFAELQDKELEAAGNLLKISPRAAGRLPGHPFQRRLSGHPFQVLANVK